MKEAWVGNAMDEDIGIAFSEDIRSAMPRPEPAPPSRAAYQMVSLLRRAEATALTPYLHHYMIQNNPIEG